MASTEHVFRSPKQAARAEAVRLDDGQCPHNLEYTSAYDESKHIQFPRMIETKPSRFAITAVLLDRLANTIFEGEGDEVRLPELKRLRDHGRKKMFTEEDDPTGLLQLEYDWGDMDYKAAIKAVIEAPENQDMIEQYGEIMLDIMTDPNAEESAFEGKTVDDMFNNPELPRDFTEQNIRTELGYRMNLAGGSVETSISGRVLIRWALDELPPEVTTDDEKRRFIIGLIPFFEKLSELEERHLHEYYFNGEWSQNDITAERAGVSLVKDGNGDYDYRLTGRRERPERTAGKPVGCPAGFTFESIATDGIGKMIDRPSVIRRSLTAFVNEAYDRGVLSA